MAKAAEPFVPNVPIVPKPVGPILPPHIPDERRLVDADWDDFDGWDVRWLRAVNLD